MKPDSINMLLDRIKGKEKIDCPKCHNGHIVCDNPDDDFPDIYCDNPKCHMRINLN